MNARALKVWALCLLAGCASPGLRRENRRLEAANKALAGFTVTCLEKRADPKDPQPLIEALKIDQPELRVYAAGELAKLKWEGAALVLIARLQDPSPEVQIAIIAALGETRDPRAASPLEARLQDASPAIVTAAARALGLVRNRTSVRPLIGILERRDEEVLVAAIVSLGLIGDPEAVPHVEKRLRHPAPRVRESAAAALGKLKVPVVIPSLCRLLEDPSPRVRWYAVDSLGEIGDPAAVRSLLEAFPSAELKLREAIAGALGRIGSAEPEVSALLVAASRARTTPLEKAAWQALLQIGERHPNAVGGIARGLRKATRHKDAITLLEGFLKNAARQEPLPKTAEARQMLAESYLAQKMPEKAEPLLKELAAAASAAPDAVLRWVGCLQEMKRHDAALEACAGVAARDPKSEAVWTAALQSLEALVRTKNLAAARKAVEALSKSAPELGGPATRKRIESLLTPPAPEEGTRPAPAPTAGKPTPKVP